MSWRSDPTGSTIVSGTPDLPLPVEDGGWMNPKMGHREGVSEDGPDTRRRP